jgi:hypothetical protein
MKNQERFAEKNATFVSGDFFQEGSVPEARDNDVRCMRCVLHDWSDEKCLIILRSIRPKMGNKKATLLVGESAAPDRTTSVGVPSVIHNVDVQKMMAVFGDALKRAPKMWKELLNQARFDMEAIHPIPGQTDGGCFRRVQKMQNQRLRTSFRFQE